MANMDPNLIRQQS